MGDVRVNQLCAFDPVSGELYASVASDNRLRIWNTVGQALLREICVRCGELGVCSVLASRRVWGLRISTSHESSGCATHGPATGVW